MIPGAPVHGEIISAAYELMSAVLHLLRRLRRAALDLVGTPACAGDFGDAIWVVRISDPGRIVSRSGPAKSATIVVTADV